MKKIILISLSLTLLMNISFGQRKTSTVKWFSIAAKAGAGSSMFINSNIFNDPNVNLNLFTLSHSFGGRFTFTYGDHLGFGSDLLFSSYGQKYGITATDITYDKTVKISTMDIVPFFRYSGNSGGYFEIGGKLSNRRSISESNSNNVQGVLTGLDSNFETKFTSAMIGFGTALFKTERLDINLGARISYSFTDVLPNHSFNIVNDGVYVADYFIDSPTNPFSIQAVLEVNYFFAFWGDASCGRGRFMLFQ